jgi:hypothetical protein
LLPKDQFLSNNSQNTPAQKHNLTGKAHLDFICFTSGQNNVFKCRLTYCKAGMKEGEVGIRKDGTDFFKLLLKLAVKII